jgi:hypothetical protein
MMDAMVSIITKPMLFGVNAVALVGFIIIGLSVGLRRAQRLRWPIAIALQLVGAAFVVAGFFTLNSSG